MKRERKIYDPAFKTKAVQISKERTNASELAPRTRNKSDIALQMAKII